MLAIVLIALGAAGAGDGQGLTILATGFDQGPAPYIKVAAGDLDGDGAPDEAAVKLDCSGPTLRGAAYTLLQRESASGMPTGKRMHKPVRIVKEWDAATPQLAKLRPQYDVKKMEGARAAAAAGGWTALDLQATDGLCPAVADAIVKSKSNITNN